MAVEPDATDISKNLEQSANKIASFALTQNPNLSDNDMKSISDSAKEYMQDTMKEMDSSHKPYGVLAMAFHAKADPGPYNQAKELGVIFDKQGNIQSMIAVKPSEENAVAQKIGAGLNIPAKNAEDLLKPDSNSKDGYTAATLGGATSHSTLEETKVTIRVNPMLRFQVGP